MRGLVIALIVALLMGGLSHPAESQSLADVVARARPSVVLVFSRLPGDRFASGTGFIASREGHILTAYHIFRNGGVPGIMLPGGAITSATIVRVDPSSDVAVLRMPRTDLPALTLGDSGSVRIGEEIAVIGYPLADVLSPREVTVTRGIVSSLRDGGSILQSDAAINPGNSGGPVLNSRGEVIGIVNSMLREAVGVNFAIAINRARETLAQAGGTPLASPTPPTPAPLTPPSPPPPPLPPPQGTGSYVVVIAPNQPVVIAYWLVVEGPDAALGIDSRRGIEIAIEDKREVFGHQIRLVGEDEGCNAEGGVRAATRIASNPSVVAAIGSSCSSASVPGAPILWRARIPTVSPSNTAPRLTSPSRSPEYDGYLRVSHNDLVQGQVAAQFTRGVLQVRRAATIHDGSPYAEGLVAEFTRAFRELGGVITGEGTVSPTDRDMRPVLTRLALTSPEMLYFPVFIAAGAFIARQTREVPGLQGIRLMGADGIFSPDFLLAAGDAAMGMYFTSQDLSVEALGPGYQAFLEKYRRRYRENPLAPFHPHAYDAASIILKAIESVGRRDSNGRLVIDRVAVRNALYATRGFQGLTGTITCNAYGDCADPKPTIYQAINTDPRTWNPGVNPRKVYP